MLLGHAGISLCPIIMPAQQHICILRHLKKEINVYKE